MPNKSTDEPKFCRMNRDLKKGDIIRTKVRVKTNQHYGKYAYAVCSGDGFGCSLDGMGNAIFVDHQGYDVNEVIAKKDAPTGPETHRRWERFWGIDILVQ